jgi:hypothetical protein
MFGNVTPAASTFTFFANGSEVLVGKTFAGKHNLNAPERIVEKKQGGGIGGSIVRDIIVVSTLEIGGSTFEKVRGAIDPQPTAGDVNVGTSVLRNFVLVIDSRNTRFGLAAESKNTQLLIRHRQQPAQELLAREA